MNKKKKDKIYQTGIFWAILVILAAIVVVIFNIDNLTSEDFNPERPIHPYTREVGSGTRSAFTEVTGLVNEDGDDIISLTATVQNSTNGITQTIASDPHGIGYISLGSLNDSVKPLSVDDVEPTSENIQAGDYQLVRYFNVMYGEELSDVAQDFWNFMFSAQAQNLVEDTGFIPVDSNAPAFEPADVSGSIMIVGSTSVEPVISVFAEEYEKINPDVTIDITAPGSGAGITMAIDGSADIGMSSREPTDDEAAELMETRPIAIDGIVMIVNRQNPADNIDFEDIRRVYLADYEYPNTWNDILKKIK